MKTRTLLVVLLCLAACAIVRADTYIEFRTSRFYSANGSYFVEVRPDRRATLYRVRPRTERVWSQVLAKLPGALYITNDGTRVVMVEHYYGNGGEPSAKVVIFFDQAGKQIADHALQDVAALKLVPHTISAAHWYRGGLFTPDQTTFIVETAVRTCDPPKLNPQTEAEITELWKCESPTPYEELRFSMSNGAVVSRESVREKYLDKEKRLLRELEFIRAIHPTNQMSLAEVYEDYAAFLRERQRVEEAKKMERRARVLRRAYR